MTADAALASQTAADVFDSMADWVMAARDATLSDKVAHLARRAVLDALVNCLLGGTTTEGRLIVSFLERDSGTCLIPGTGTATTAAGAAFAGAALAQVHDGNDGNPRAASDGSAYHPGRVVVPTALAVAQEAGLSGAEFLKAVAIGYDLAIGTQCAPVNVPPDAYGAAAVASYAQRSPSGQAALAMRLAGFHAPTSGPGDFETNNLTIAHQARAGIEAVRLAQRGYPPSTPMSLRAEGFSFNRPAGLGATLSELYFKPFPACRKTHPFVEAAIALHPTYAAAPASVQAVRLYITARDRAPAHCLGPGAYYKSYQFSIGYCTAIALRDGTLGPTQFQPRRTDDPAVRQLQDATMFIVDEDRSGTVELEFVDGSRHLRRVIDALGGRTRAMSDAQIAARLVDWVGWQDAEAERLLETVVHLDEAADLGGLLAMLRR